MSSQEAHRLIREARTKRVSGLTRNIHPSARRKEKQKDHRGFLAISKPLYYIELTERYFE